MDVTPKQTLALDKWSVVHLLHRGIATTLHSYPHTMVSYQINSLNTSLQNLAE